MVHGHTLYTAPLKVLFLLLFLFVHNNKLDILVLVFEAAHYSGKRSLKLLMAYLYLSYHWVLWPEAAFFWRRRRLGRSHW